MLKPASSALVSSFVIYTSTFSSAPFLRLHLCLGHVETVQDQFLGGFHQGIRAASVENSVWQVVDVFLDPGGVNATAPAGPWVLLVNARAGHVKIKVRILLREFVELCIEDDVVRGAHA